MSSLPTEQVEHSVGFLPEEIAEIRREADDDVFYFGRVICGHHDLVYEDHAPLMYAAAGEAGKLLAMLRSETVDSYTLFEMQAECERLGIDIHAEDAEARLAEALRIVDERVYRHSGKSSAITHTVRCWKISKDPNLTSVLITNTDPKAGDFCKQIRATILSDLYAVVYPDRVPADPKSALTENRITVAGRTVPDMEPCLMAFGVKVAVVGYHFDEFHFDDLVGRENKSVAELAIVKEFLANITGMYKPGIRYRVRRIHVGTRWDEEDDAAIIRKNERVFRITIPIWKRRDYTDNVLEAGVPTTAWYPLSKIRAEQDEVLTNDEEGLISWLCNYELNPSIAGGRVFPPQRVDEEKWEAHFDERLTLKSPLKNPRTAQAIWVKHEERYEKDGENGAKAGERVVNRESGKFVNRVFDPTKLYIVSCCDQSFLPEGGDEWAVGTVGMDQYAVRNVLEMTSGHGIEAMLDAAEMHRVTWKPHRIGFEDIAAQHAIDLVMKFGTKYRYLRSLIEPVKHGGKSKEWRIRNYVAGLLLIHRLKLSPFDPDTATEMKKYRPGPTAKDNRLDVLAMCEILIRNSLTPKDGEKDKGQQLRKLNSQRRAERVAFYGI